MNGFELKKIGLGVALMFAATKVSMPAMAKGAVASIGAVIAAKGIPVVKDYI